MLLSFLTPCVKITPSGTFYKTIPSISKIMHEQENRGEVTRKTYLTVYDMSV